MKKLFLAAAAVLFALAAPAGGQTIVRCRTSGGSAIDCTAPLGNSYVNWASPGAIGSVTPAAVTATTFTGSGSGLTSVPAASVTGSLSGVTINCSSNTCSNVSLTAAVTGVLPIANGGTNSSTALGNNRVIVSSGGKLVETASACGAGTVLVGGSPPDCGSWITSVAGISTLGSTYTISADNGAYEDTGLSVTLPSAGTYIVWYTARTNISALTTAGAFVEVELYNSTDAGAIANSEEIGAYASTLSASYYGVPHLNVYVTVATSKVIKLYAKVVAPGSTTIRTVNSDTYGRTNMGYIKIAP